MGSLEEYAAQRESDVLEFKAARSVQDPLILPRAVCALLNSEGGEVIVGLDEVPGGFRPDPIPDPERARIQVRDRLLATIDPVPTGVAIEPIDSLGMPAGLRIVVGKGDVLYAVRRKEGALLFVRREHDRVVPMSSLEVQQRSRSAASREEDDPQTLILAKLEDWRRYCMDQSSVLPHVGGLFFVARMLPEPKEPLRAWRDEVESWYADPMRIGLRREGTHFLWRDLRLERSPGRDGSFRTGAWEAGFMMAEYTPRGGFQFATRLDRLRIDYAQRRTHDHPVIHPVSLLEHVSACARVFAGLWRERPSPPSARAWAALVLVGTDGLELLPGHYSHFDDFLVGRQRIQPWSSSELGPSVTSAELDELRATPDRLAHRLLTQLYVHYGLEKEHVPYFDPDRGKFIFD